MAAVSAVRKARGRGRLRRLARVKKVGATLEEEEEEDEGAEDEGRGERVRRRSAVGSCFWFTQSAICLTWE